MAHPLNKPIPFLRSIGEPLDNEGLSCAWVEVHVKSTEPLTRKFPGSRPKSKNAILAVRLVCCKGSDIRRQPCHSGGGFWMSGHSPKNSRLPALPLPTLKNSLDYVQALLGGFVLSCLPVQECSSIDPNSSTMFRSESPSTSRAVA